jgi:hypothetical protein
MGTWPRSWSRRRVTSLAAAALGTALAAVFVARRRPSPPPSRTLTPSPMPTGAVQEQPADAPDRVRHLAGAPLVDDADEVVPDATYAEPTTVRPVADIEDGQSMDQPVRRPGENESNAGLSPPGGRSRTGVVALGLGLLVVVAAGLVSIVLGRDDDPREAAGVRATTLAEQTTTTAIDDVSPEEAFARAADRLVSGGSFGYVGTTSAIDVSHVRPGLWLAVDLTVEGEVVTSAGRVHEIAVDGSGRAIETVTEGPVVWGRLAPTREALPEASYLSITEESGVQRAGKGAALLPTWLDSTVDRQDAGTDDLGNRVLRATLPASVLGEIVDGRPAGDATVVLMLDAAGDPVHVEVTSVPTGPPLRLALDLVGIGEPVLIDLPAL